jgi:L-amino acid N-acyltransferase YncA
MAEELIRPAEPTDAPALVAIYNQGIEERQATFETRPRTADDLAGWLDPLLVAERDGEVAGWAGIAPYSDRDFYAGVGECTIYVEREARGSGLGARLLEELAAEAERRGYHKLTAKLFPENDASVGLFRRHGFREVGVHRRHGRLDGEWRDVVVVERLLGEALQDRSPRPR